MEADKLLDKIIIEELQLYGYHGVLEEEKRLGQKFLVSLVLYGEFIKSENNDRIEDTISYSEVCHFIEGEFTKKSFDLIESVANYIGIQLLIKFPGLKKVDVEVKKPWAPIGLPFKNVSVFTSKEWHTVYLALGSNMGDKASFLDMAISELNKDPLSKNVAESKRMITKPYGYLDQDDFLNSCVCIKTIRNPKEMLSLTQSIEMKANRERKIHWGPRTLDVDILLFDDIVYQDDNLIIPHVDMANREFVLAPLMEIAPYYIHPILLKSIKQIFQELQEGKKE